MKTKIVNERNRVIGLGAIAGMRSMSGPSMLSNYLTDHRSRQLKKTSFDFMQTDKTAKILKVLAIGEKIADKLPGAPNRINAGALIGRGIAGGLVGATVSNTKRKMFGGIGLGVVSAVAATYVSFYVRKKLSKKTFIPDAVWGLAEDLLVAKIGRNVLS